MKEPKGKNKKGCLRSVVAVIVVLIGLMFLGQYFDKSTFEANKPQILKDAREALEAKELHKVESILEEYEIMDDTDLKAIASDLENLKSELEQQASVKARQLSIERVTKQLRASTTPSERQSLLEELSRVDPKNKEFSKELEAMKLKRQLELANRRAERKKKEADRLASKKKVRVEYIVKLNAHWYYSKRSDVINQ